MHCLQPQRLSTASNLLPPQYAQQPPATSTLNSQLFLSTLNSLLLLSMLDSTPQIRLPPLSTHSLEQSRHTDNHLLLNQLHIGTIVLLLSLLLPQDSYGFASPQVATAPQPAPLSKTTGTAPLQHLLRGDLPHPPTSYSGQQQPPAVDTTAAPRRLLGATLQVIHRSLKSPMGRHHPLHSRLDTAGPSQDSMVAIRCL
jgi:hypothetical protein